MQNNNALYGFYFAIKKLTEPTCLKNSTFTRGVARRRRSQGTPFRYKIMKKGIGKVQRVVFYTERFTEY